MKKESLKDKNRIAFVASGGAVKAACFHVGVCLALERKGLQFKGGLGKKPQPLNPQKQTVETYVGSSAGSMITTFLAAGYSLKEIVKSFVEPSSLFKKNNTVLAKFHYTDLFHLARPNIGKYLSFLWKSKRAVATGSIEAFFKNHLTLGGIFTTEGVETYLRKKVLPSNRFEDLAANLFVVATQLDHPFKTVFCGHQRLKYRPEHHTLYESNVKISDAVAASTALPPIYQPYPIKIEKEKIYFYDGEIQETLSTHVAKDLGCDLVIASYTHEPYRYHPQVGSLVNYGISAITIQAIYQAIEQKIHTSQRLHHNKKIALETVDTFFREQGLPDSKRAHLCEILEEKLQFNKHVKYIFIHPLPQDAELFLADHFNLSKQHMMKIVKSGFKSAIYHLRNYEFK